MTETVTLEAIAGTDPATVTAAMQALWTARAAQLGIDVEIADCPYSADDLARLAEQGRRPAYLPAEVATQDGRARLGEVFPLMQSWVTAPDNVVVNDEDPWGWFDYETAVAAPNTDLDEAGTRDAAARTGRSLLSLNQYIVASQDSVQLTGEYLDSRGSWSRVGSLFDGHALACRFDGTAPPEDVFGEEPAPGALLVGYDLGSGDRGAILGSRSSTLVHHLVPPSPPRLRYDATRLPVPVIGDLAAERDRIIAAFVALGYHEALGLSASAYAASFPAFAPQAEGYRGRFDVPLVVETRLGWRDQAARAGIVLSGGRQNFDYVPADERSKVRPTPYTAWFTWWGQRFPDPVAPADARADLAEDEVGANLHEAIAMHVAHPELLLAGRFLEPVGYLLEGAYDSGLTGFANEIVRTACLYHWRRSPEISANLHPIAFSIFRPLVRGTAVAERRAAPSAAVTTRMAHQ